LPDGAAAIESAGSPAVAASGGAGVLALSDGGVATGYLLVLLGLALAVLSPLVAARRRSRSVAPPVTATDTAGERT
jgi:hypothetical protein